MKRWPARVLAAVSLLLMLAVGVFWVRAAMQMEDFARHSVRTAPQTYDEYYLVSLNGAIEIARVHNRVFYDTDPEGWHCYSPPTLEPESLHKRILGHWSLERHMEHLNPGSTGRRIRVPDWFAMLLALSLSFPWLISRRRTAKARRLAESNACPACGYDLRATPERCPECGRVTP